MVDRQEIRRFLIKCGIRPHLGGFRLLEYAIELVLGDVGYLGALTKGLYPAVGARFQCDPAVVERSMRYAIQRCCEFEEHFAVLGFPPRYSSGAYTVGEFLSGAYYRLSAAEA